MKKESVADALWRYAPKIAGITGVAVGMLVLLGWMFDISLVHHPRYGNLSIKTNAAICFLLAGAVLWIQSITLKQQSRRWQNTARIFIAVLLFIAGATLYEHLAGADLNIDQMLFREKADAFDTLAPNRMTLPTTISFLLLGIALALNAPSAAYNRWRRVFTILAMFPAMTSLLGVVYGLPPQYGIGHVTQMTVRSSLIFFILAFGILASHPQLSLLSIFRAPGIGSLFARRLILAALLLPPLLGGLTLAGARFGLHEMEFALVITASIHIFVLSILILSTAKFLQDIDTKRKLSEEVLHTSEEQFYNAFNSSNFPIMILAEDDEVIAVNKAWTQQTGYSRQDMPTLDDWTRRAYPEKYDEVNTLVHDLFNREAVPELGEFEIRTKYGGIRIWECSSAPIGHYADGRRLLMGSAKDITERRQAEKSLHIMSMAIEQSPAAVMITDVNTKIQYINPKFTELTGYTPKEAIGRSSGILRSRAQSEEYYLGTQHTVQNGNVWHGEVHSQKKDGEMFWEQVSIAPILNAQGAITNVVTIKEDISKRKHAEEALLIRKQQLKGLYARLHTIREEERRRFSRELHDELGQMLTALRIDLNWLEDSLASAKTPVLAKLETMNLLLDQTVDAVRQISEDLRPGMLDSLGLAPAIENYVGKFSIRTGIKCDLHIPEDDFTIGSKISIVIFRLTQEALNNAAKYANADRISIHLEHHADKIVLAIQDNGCGLAEPGEKKSSGFGILGMRERVAMLNGRFSISNSPGGGVRIEAAIPLQENVDLIHTFLNPTQQ